MDEISNILYYLVVYFVEFVKFFLIDKYVFGWKQKKWNWKRMLVAISGLLTITFFMLYLSEQINPLVFYAFFLIIETLVIFEEITWKLVFVTITEIYAIGVIDVMIQQMYAVVLEVLESNLQLPMELIVSATTILFLMVVIHVMSDKMQGYVTRIPIRYYLIFLF